MVTVMGSLVSKCLVPGMTRCARVAPIGVRVLPRRVGNLRDGFLYGDAQGGEGVQHILLGFGGQHTEEVGVQVLDAVHRPTGVPEVSLAQLGDVSLVACHCYS